MSPESQNLGLSSYLTKTNIHIATEVLVLGALSYYFYKKNSQLTTALTTTQTQLTELTTRFNNLENAFRSLIESLQQRPTMQSQTQSQPQHQRHPESSHKKKKSILKTPPPPARDEDGEEVEDLIEIDKQIELIDA